MVRRVSLLAVLLVAGCHPYAEEYPRLTDARTVKNVTPTSSADMGPMRTTSIVIEPVEVPAPREAPRSLEGSPTTQPSRVSQPPNR